MKKTIVVLIVGLPILFAGLFLFVLYEGPRMRVQHHVREFQMIMPNRAAGTVTVASHPKLPSAADAVGLKNPLPASAENFARAAVYYQYYCVFCHGYSGAGDGPVGQSYIPRPADLKSVKIAGYRDGELLRSMLIGNGHEPVLERVVPPEHRWYLVLHLRSLQQRQPQKP